MQRWTSHVNPGDQVKYLHWLPPPASETRLKFLRGKGFKPLSSQKSPFAREWQRNCFLYIIYGPEWTQKRLMNESFHCLTPYSFTCNPHIWLSCIITYCVCLLITIGYIVMSSIEVIEFSCLILSWQSFICKIYHNHVIGIMSKIRPCEARTTCLVR